MPSAGPELVRVFVITLQYLVYLQYHRKVAYVKCSSIVIVSCHVPSVHQGTLTHIFPLCDLLLRVLLTTRSPNTLTNSHQSADIHATRLRTAVMDPAQNKFPDRARVFVPRGKQGLEIYVGAGRFF